MKRTRRDLAALGIVLPVAVATLFFALPLLGLVLRAPWSELFERLASPRISDALLLSIACSTVAAFLAAAFGLPLAVYLANDERAAWHRSIVRVLVTLPMVLPPVVAGVALLLVFGRRGLVGSALDDWFGWTLPFSSAGVVLATTYVAMPFFVLSAEAGLRSLDRRYEDVAATLGARPWYRFSRVTLPRLAPSLAAGLVVAWARAIGEFGATITFAGNLRGETRTMPLEVFIALENDPEAAIVLSLILVLLAATLLFSLRGRWMR